MKRQLQFVLCFVTASTCPVFAQSSAATSESKRTETFVYVSTAQTAEVNAVHAFTAAEDGKLTRVAGSPFAANLSALAVTADSLFGTVPITSAIDSFSITEKGALRHAASMNGQKYNAGDCGGPGPIFVDRTGTSLYDLDVYGDACANNTYQSYRVDKSTGGLDYQGRDGSSEWFNTALSFTGNNTYAYGAVCLNDMYWQIYGFKRHRDGMLIEANVDTPTPAASGIDFYCPSLTATDTTNHVVISMQAVDGETFNPDGPARLATYTSEDNGNLTTRSTRDDMAKTEVGTVSGMAIAPSDKLLAVGGSGGLQLFHFEGGEPIKPYTGLLTRDSITQIVWDYSNHLYAISQASGKLFVYRITAAGIAQAPGSPYRLSNPLGLAVLLKDSPGR